MNNNPLRYIDPSGNYPCSSHPDDAEGNNYCYGIEISPGFSEEERNLILATLLEYADFLGEDAFLKNISVNLKRIWKDETLFNNAFYNYADFSIRVGANLLHTATKDFIQGKSREVPVFTMGKEYGGHPDANLGQAQYFQFVLAHEMTHALVQTSLESVGFLSDFRARYYDVEEPYDNVLIVQNKSRARGHEELFADAVAAYALGLHGLSNGAYDEWIRDFLPGFLQ